MEKEKAFTVEDLSKKARINAFNNWKKEFPSDYEVFLNLCELLSYQFDKDGNKIEK